MKFGVLCLVLLTCAQAARAEITFSEFLRERMEWLMFQSELEIDGEAILSRELLPDLYAENEYQPLWGERSRLVRLSAGAGSG